MGQTQCSIITVFKEFKDGNSDVNWLGVTPIKDSLQNIYDDIDQILIDTDMSAVSTDASDAVDSMNTAKDDFDANIAPLDIAYPSPDGTGNYKTLVV